MTTVDVSSSSRNHIQRLVKSLALSGWRAVRIPASGLLKRSQQCIEFRVPRKNLKIRFLIFSIGDRGEPHRRNERRIQITTTFQSGLKRLRDFSDVILGYDAVNDAYVGLDARRLEYGGEKHNASSSVDPLALENPPADGIFVRPHETQILGLEYQAIFRPERLAEYIFNSVDIHRGLYVGDGLFSKPAKTARQISGRLTVRQENARDELLVVKTAQRAKRTTRTKKRWLAAYENGNEKRLVDLTPEELEAVRRRCAEIGDRGEYFVLQYEKKRLRKAGKPALANKVDWVSRRAVGRGYDISSFNSDGAPRLIEVKSTTGKSRTFLISDNEWKVAAAKEREYYIYRIVNVEKAAEVQQIVRDPLNELAKGNLIKTAAGWKVTLL